MLFIKMVRYCRGYVRFTATGVFLERFLNIAVRKGINLWDASKEETVLTACTDVRAYKRLRPYAKKTGVRLHVVERHGLPFRTRRYRKRKGLFIGILLFLVFLFGMGQFVWRIEVVGNQEVSTQEILSTVGELGLHTGALKVKLDTREVERETMLRLQRLSWVAVNMEGSTVTVEVRERVMPPEMFPDNDGTYNIVADRTGLIVYMEVYEGQKVLKVGDTVKAGEVIVSGIIEDKKGQATYKHARAKIIAQTDYEITVEQPKVEEVKTMTGEQKTRNYLRVFGVDLPLFLYHPFRVAYDLQRETTPVSVFGLALPMTYIHETYDFYTTQQVPLTSQEAEQKALKLLEQQEQQELGDAKVLERQLERKELDNVYIIKAKYLCNIDIAKEQEILIKE